MGTRWMPRDPDFVYFFTIAEKLSLVHPDLPGLGVGVMHPEPAASAKVP